MNTNTDILIHRVDNDLDLVCNPRGHRVSQGIYLVLDLGVETLDIVREYDVNASYLRFPRGVDGDHAYVWRVGVGSAEEANQLAERVAASVVADEDDTAALTDESEDAIRAILDEFDGDPRYTVEYDSSVASAEDLDGITAATTDSEIADRVARIVQEGLENAFVWDDESIELYLRRYRDELND